MRIVIVIFLLVFLCAAGWELMYPSSNDPKNMKYVLWKAGLYKMNPEVAVGTMVGDPNRDNLVVGKTKAQLRDKFGSLPLPTEASPYLRGCYQASPWKDSDVLFIRQ